MQEQEGIAPVETNLETSHLLELVSIVCWSSTILSCIFADRISAWSCPFLTKGKPISQRSRLAPRDPIPTTNTRLLITSGNATPRLSGLFERARHGLGVLESADTALALDRDKRALPTNHQLPVYSESCRSVPDQQEEDGRHQYKLGLDAKEAHTFVSTHGEEEGRGSP